MKMVIPFKFPSVSYKENSEMNTNQISIMIGNFIGGIIGIGVTYGIHIISYHINMGIGIIIGIIGIGEEIL
jgi:formate/nitrite transporter FocA (FNT family)